MQLAPASPASPIAPASTAPALPPLQQRTPEQLKEGMVVAVKGAGSADLAVARLIQDGAQYMARAADTTLGLATVEVNYAAADRQGALGLATFQGNKGWFALSQRSTKGLLEGIDRLRTTKWSDWTEAQRQAFVQSNETILHEASHVTLNGYTNADVDAWHGANRDFEEGLAEIANMTHIRPFMQEEFGVDIGDATDRISQSVSAYTRFTERIERMIGMGTDGSAAAIAAAGSRIGDKVPADQRLPEIATAIGLALGGPTAPPALVAEIAKTLPGFVAEQNGTRTKLMEIQAALVDHAAGRPVDVPALLAHLHELDAAHPALTPPRTNGFEPLD
ncbi:MAG: hypothetical protein JWM98_2861 [Thermoleophilia bacterium]|nr:hypothetical protein [Thermoleophilia bacterium]